MNGILYTTVPAGREGRYLPLHTYMSPIFLPLSLSFFYIIFCLNRKRANYNFLTYYYIYIQCKWLKTKTTDCVQQLRVLGNPCVRDRFLSISQFGDVTEGDRDRKKCVKRQLDFRAFPYLQCVHCTVWPRSLDLSYTICPRSSDQFYVVRYYGFTGL